MATEDLVNLLNFGEDSTGPISNIPITDEMKKRYKVIDKNKSVSPEAKALGGEGDRPENPVPRVTEIPDVRLGKDFDVSGALNEEGARAGFDGITPDGAPDAAQIKEAGKGISSIADALSKPGVQKFLGQLGIAFSGNRPNEAGTILGNYAVNQADAKVEQNLLGRALAGENISDISAADLGGTPTTEAIRNAEQAQRQQSQFERTAEQKDTQLEQGQQRIDQGEESLDLKTQQVQANIDNMLRDDSRASDQFKKQYELDKERLRLLEKRIGLEAGRLNLAKMRALSEINQGSKPTSVESWQYGAALDTVTQKYLDQATENMNEDEIKSFMARVNNPQTGYDAQAILNELNPSQREQALKEAQGLSKQYAQSFSSTANPDALLDFDGILTKDEAKKAADGSVFRTRINGELITVRKNGNKLEEVTGGSQ